MNKQKKDLFVFGYGLAVILTFFGLRSWHKHGFGPWPTGFLALALVFVILTTLRLDWIKLLYDRWMIVARFIGHNVTLIILTVLYYGVFGIVGIILRLMRKDLLNEKIDHAVASYWIKREKKLFNQNDYKRQF